MQEKADAAEGGRAGGDRAGGEPRQLPRAACGEAVRARPVASGASVSEESPGPMGSVRGRRGGGCAPREASGGGAALAEGARCSELRLPPGRAGPGRPSLPPSAAPRR